MDGFTSAGAQTLIPEAYRAVRARTDALTAHLSAEDCMLQSMDDASPVKWHLGHTTWFWETFILREALADYSVFDLQYHYLFNSYYVSLGDRQARPQRGLLSRPTLEKIRAYRAHVDRAMEAFFDAGLAETYRARIELGIAHEEQHQELILTDLKHGFAQHAFSPAAYPDTVSAQAGKPQSLQDMPFQTFEGGLAEIGRGEEDGFAFDNEGPTHQVYIGPFSLAHRCISNGGWREFMADGGYETPSLWFSEGWARVQSEGWRAPLYWRFKDGDWVRFSLHGEVAIDPAARSPM